MGGSPCDGPKRSAPGKNSAGDTFGRYVASSPAARAGCVHTQIKRAAASMKAATRPLQAAKEILNMEDLWKRIRAPGGKAYLSDLEGKCRMSPLTSPKITD